MKYKVGDKVLIKSLDWYNENKDINGNVHCGDKVFDNYMSVFCGSVVTIGGVYPYTAYDIREDMHCRAWTDEMIECKVEEEVGLVDNFSSRWVNEFELPDGYIFKDENGNIINAQKIVLEKKGNRYPKTYEECSAINGAEGRISLSIIGKFTRLINARNAYWRIAGQEMGLGKPWKPDWCDYENIKYIIGGYDGEIGYDQNHHIHKILAFPTVEMRDAFYENFKEEIEICKEFL